MAGKHMDVVGQSKDEDGASQPYNGVTMDFDTASTSSLLSESICFQGGDRKNPNNRVEGDKNMGKQQSKSTATKPTNESQEAARPHHRGGFSEMFRSSTTTDDTHRFYRSEEMDHPTSEGFTASYEKTNRQMSAAKIPSWVLMILVHVLGIQRSSTERRSYLSVILHVITVLLASTFTVTGVVHTVFDIRSKFSNTTLLTGCVNMLIGFCWICLGMYSHRLAARLFSNRNFSESVRVHSRTFLKISAAGLLMFFSVALAGLDLYSSYIAFGPNHCITIYLHASVCHVMYYSHIGFTVVGLIWNILVGCVLLSVCRTHTIGIRKFIQELEQDAKVCEAVCKENILRYRRASVDMDIVHSGGSWFIWDDRPDQQRTETNNQRCGIYHPLDNDGSINSGTGVSGDQNTDQGYSVQTCNINSQEQDVESSKSERPPVLTDNEILMSYWKISNRMRLTSRGLQRWMASWIAFILLWCVDYVIIWISRSATVIDICQFVLPVILLLIVTSAFAEANGEGQRMITCICPTRERLTILYYLNQQPLQMKVFNTSITYSAIVGVILAFSVAFVSRIILDEVL